MIKHLPKIAWRTLVSNVVMLPDNEYRINVSPIDVNEPGAVTREIGNYFKDYVGHTYLITESTSTTITMLDSFGVGVGPQTGMQGFVYESVDNGESPYLAPIFYRHLDKSAYEYSRPIELSVLWENSQYTGMQSGKLTNLSSRTVLVTFDREFNEVPAGWISVHRWSEITAGKFRKKDVRYYHIASTDITNEGFSLEIDSNESLSGAIVEYCFFEKKVTSIAPPPDL
jgi:hypothetical protein